jgi:FSR family fosmidomycin resistance protein-like MFS transporter
VKNRALAVYLIAGTTYAGGLSRNFLIPLRAHELGASRLTIGLLATVALLVAAAISLPSGYLADRLGRRGTIVLSVLCGLLAQALSAASPEIWPLFVAAAVSGLGLGGAQTAVFAVLADSVERSRIGRAMGWLTFSMQAGFLVGPALSGLLLGVLSTRADLALTTLFWVAALPLTAAMPGGARETTWRVGLAGALLRRPGFQAALLGTLTMGMLWGTLQGYLPIFGKEALALPGTLIGYLLAVQAAANGLSRLVVGRISDLFLHQWPLVVAGGSFTGLSLVVLPHLGGFAAPAALLALSVPFSALGFIALSVSFANLSDDSNRGLVMGFYSAILFAGLGLGPALYGPAMQASYIAGFTICGFVGVVMAALVPLVRWAPRRHSDSVILPPAA